MFLRTLIAVEPGVPSERVSSTLDDVGAIARRAESLEGLRKRLAVEPFDLVIIDRAWSETLSPGLIHELRELPEAVREAGLGAPSVIVLGRVVAEESLALTEVEPMRSALPGLHGR